MEASSRKTWEDTETAEEYRKESNFQKHVFPPSSVQHWARRSCSLLSCSCFTCLEPHFPFLGVAAHIAYMSGTHSPARHYWEYGRPPIFFFFFVVAGLKGPTHSEAKPLDLLFCSVCSVGEIQNSRLFICIYFYLSASFMQMTYVNTKKQATSKF